MSKSDFHSAQLGDVTTLSQGLAINAKTSHLLSREGLPLLRIKDLISGSAEQFVNPEEAPRKAYVDFDDVVFTRTGQVGLVFRGRKGILHNNSFKVDPDQKILSKGFLFWFLRQKSIYQYVNQAASGSVQKDLKHDLFRQIEIAIPDLSTQESVVNVLDCLEEKIELNRKTNETLEGIAKALFKSWFVDFDPVRAKAEGRPTGLPNETSELFPDSFEDSELGEIPSGWTIAEVGDLVDFQNGFAFKSSDWQDDGVPVVKIGSVKPGIVDLSSVSFVSDEVAAVAGRYRLSSGDILIGMTGYVGEVGLVPLATKMPLLNQRVGKLSPLDPHLKEFVYCFSRSTDFKEKVEQLSHGSAQANVSSKSICGIQVPLPTRDLLTLFSATNEPILSRLLFCHRESEILSSLRDALLPRLISGELRVPDAEKMLEEVGI